MSLSFSGTTQTALAVLHALVAHPAPFLAPAARQVSNAHACVLAPVAHLSCVPPALASLMEDATVWKVGCGIASDADKVSTDLGVRMASLFDAGVVAKRLGRHLAPGPPGLKGLCGHFGVVLQKDKRITLSDWQARPLTALQAAYAAQDAFASHWLVTRLHASHANRDETLPDWLARHSRGGSRAAYM
jgi:ribonuclease D